MAKETQVQTNEEAEKKHVDELVARVAAAQKKYAEYTQEQVDHIFRRVALKLSSLRIPLAKMAVEETGMGVVEDKVIKNHFASEYIYNKFKNTKTCGILEEDKANGLIKIAEPLGVIAGVIPTTNPTSTAIFHPELIKLLEFCQDHNIFVMIDETYVEFAPDVDAVTAVPLTQNSQNLMVLRGVSKFFAAPGMRFGYGIT